MPCTPNMYALYAWCTLHCVHAFVNRCTSVPAAAPSLQALLRGEFVEEDTVVVEADDHGLVLRKGPRVSDAQQAEAYAAAAAGRN